MMNIKPRNPHGNPAPMGNKFTQKGEFPRDKNLNIRIDAPTLNAIREKAKDQGRGVSDFVIAACLEKLK